MFFCIKEENNHVILRTHPLPQRENNSRSRHREQMDPKGKRWGEELGDSDHTYTLLIVCIKKGFYFTGLGLLYYA